MTNIVTEHKYYDLHIISKDANFVFDCKKNEIPDNFQSQYSVTKTQVIEDPNLTPREILLLIRIATFFNKKGYCWATNEYLAEMMNWSERTLRRVITSLREKNYLKTVGITFNMKTYRRIYDPDEFEKLKKFFLRPKVAVRDWPALANVYLKDIYKKNIYTNVYMQKEADSSPPPGVANAPPDRSKKIIEEKYLQLAKYFQTKVKKLNLPGKKPDISSEAKKLRLLCTKDKADYDETKRLIDWLFADSFWSEKGFLPQTIGKFREKYATYYQQFKNKEKIKSVQKDEEDNRKKAFELKSKYKNFKINCLNDGVENTLKKDVVSYKIPHKTFCEILRKWAIEQNIIKPSTCNDSESYLNGSESNNKG